MEAARQPAEVIEPPSRWGMPDLTALWRYRELLWLMTRRDLAVRYRQTLVGVAWVVIQPVAYAAVFSLALTFLRASPPGEVAYPVFVLTGLTLWLFLAGLVARCSTSLLAAAGLISKLHFPRIILPFATILPQVVDFLLAFTVLLGVMAVYGVGLEPEILLAPVFVLAGILLAFGIGLWFSAVAVRFRDVQQLVPFVLQVGLFTSPVLYSLDRLPDTAQSILLLNPVTGVLEGFRWAMLPGAPPPGAELIVSIILGSALVITGLIYFRHAQDEFADVI